MSAKFSGLVSIVAAGFGVDPSHCCDCDGPPPRDDATYLTVRIPASISISLADEASLTLTGRDPNGGETNA